MNHSMNVCADCNTPDPSWASINRGVLVCNECCSIHRSLGRQISYIRSLHAATWPPVLREMVYTLVRKGANTIWEHALHNSHSKVKIKKPGPKDKLHPTKNDFILAKYKHLLLVPHLSQKDGPSSAEDLSKQLHASVRTSNLDTCLRLLSLGANPNYSHPDRGNTPLHVAAQAGQAMQVELLFVYGANPCTLDRLGHTPEECARIAGHHQLADRLIECQYELTDKLSFFLCGRKPVHSIGEHFLVPQISGSGLNLGMTEARSRLQELSNELFEELAGDVYDEVDRRETDAFWLTTQQLHSSVAFLPVNPTLSPLRNQGRQKLATLDAQEFAQLVVDLLLDTKRRQLLSLETGQTSGTIVPSTSDEQAEMYDPHDYDEPPPDNTYSQIEELREGVVKRSSVPEVQPEYAEVKKNGHSEAHEAGTKEDVVSRTKFNLLKDRLKHVQSEKEELEVTNDVLQQRLMDMQKQLNKVIEENSQLRGKRSPSTPPLHSPPPRSPPPTIAEEEPLQLETPHVYAQVEKGKKSRSSQPPAMDHRSYSTSQPPATDRHVSLPPAMDHRSYSSSQSPAMDHRSYSASQPPATDHRSHSTSQSPAMDHRSHSSSQPPATDHRSHSSSQSPAMDHRSYSSSQPPAMDRHSLNLTPASPPPQLDHLIPTKKSSVSSDALTPPPGRQDTPLSDSPFEEPSDSRSGRPSMEDIHFYIKNITQCIQELLQAAQSQRQSSFASCSLKVVRAVEAMTKMFPLKASSPDIQVSLREVTMAAQRLQSECRDSGQSDLPFWTRHIINSAYDVAKAARHLVLVAEKSGEH